MNLKESKLSIKKIKMKIKEYVYKEYLKQNFIFKDNEKFSIYILFEENRLISRDKWWGSGGKTFVEHFLARKRKHQFDISNPRVLFMKLDSFLPLLLNCRKKKKNLGLRLISSLLSILS